MKIVRSLAILAASTLVVTSVRAQSQLSGDCSCMAMSPRVRQMMEENCVVFSPSGGSDYIQGEAVRKSGARGELVMPSSRAQAADNEAQPRAAIIVDNESNNVGYKPTCHGITASPKVRQMVMERRRMVRIYER